MGGRRGPFDKAGLGSRQRCRYERASEGAGQRVRLGPHIHREAIMNFGSVGLSEFLVVFLQLVLIWAVPFALAVWLLRTLVGMARSLRDIADRLSLLERTLRDGSTHRIT